MTEKNIFAYKLFLSLNISDFNPWKKSPPLSQELPSKSWGPVKPPPLFWKFGWRLYLHPLPQQKGGWGAHYGNSKHLMYLGRISIFMCICICIYVCMYMLWIYWLSTLENTDKNRMFFVRSPHHKHFGKAQLLVLWALWWHQLFSTC